MIKKIMLALLAVCTAISMNYVMPEASARPHYDPWNTPYHRQEREQSRNSIFYLVKMRDYDWQGIVKDGHTAGSTYGIGLECLMINTAKPMGLRYRVLIGNKGWTDWQSVGGAAGEPDSGYTIKAVQIASANHNVTYQVHIVNHGWSRWCSELQPAGNAIDDIDAIRIKLN